MKKKLISLLVLGSITLTGLSALASSAKLVIDEKPLDIPAAMGSVKEVDERILVPVRYVAEQLGYVVTYSDNNMVNGVPVESAIITAPSGTTYLVMDNSNQIYVLPGPDETTGGPITMDTPAFIQDGEDRFYAPVRFLGDALGFDADWNEETQTVSLTRR